jgi:hypothetical protein
MGTAISELATCGFRDEQPAQAFRYLRFRINRRGKADSGPLQMLRLFVRLVDALEQMKRRDRHGGHDRRG